ncbi:glycoside hydrolase family 18 protein [Pedobacter sp. N36a]|uniref:glycoside hydrolase family 18 protein n=1 Tax=Pedobacter sp. N36a TaxID=2767996 RepID=UPI0016569333|nr:glycoside hydrolase family 18 protein [Pedobacter sp. N36a]MBC8985151.1 glycoside hydrolase family 18 protein [Pedobacter sp. N36a]
MKITLGLITVVLFLGSQKNDDLKTEDSNAKNQQFAEQQIVAQKKVVIGYVGGFRGLLNPDKISPEKLTHINYAFVDVQGNRAFLTNEKTDTVNFRKLLLLKKKNPALKILISIGGWAWSKNFSDAMLMDTSRAAFATSAVNIIRKYNLDGVDIDWEYPGRPGEVGHIYRPEDGRNFTLMFEALRKELDILEKETAHNKLLTTAVGGFSDFLLHTEMDKAAQYLDYVNLMTYDYYSGKTAGHHTNLYPSALYSSEHSADKAIKAYVMAGVPISKLVMGIAFYGRNSKVEVGTATGLGANYVKGEFGSGYTQIKDSLLNKRGFKEFKDEAAKASYLYNASTQTLITYDDEWSVREKCKYVMDHHMGGVMFWEYASDPKEYLLNEVAKSFK